jgi:4-amino-4-deoxy-L-arabinose transferase-like glycosyltransferase
MGKRISSLLIIVIVIIAAFLRLYRISDYMTFLGDEGRDVLVAKGILEGHLTLLGPRASAGDFFTGPIYYYLMTPFLWLFRLDPVGPAVMVALLSVGTVFLIYYLGKKWFDNTTGLVAAALYSVSPLVITYSHSSWNPNVVPFFSLVTIVFLSKAVTTINAWKQYVLVGFFLGICVQLHYISIFLGVIVAVSLFFAQWYVKGFIAIFPLIRHYMQIFIGFLLGFSPFLAFEVRHHFQNTQAIFSFITHDTTQTGYMTYNAFYEPIADVFFRLFARLLFAFPVPVDYVKSPLLSLQLFGLTIICCAIASLILLIKQKNKVVVIILSTWIILGTLLFGFYKKPIYDYYLVFAFPLPFFLFGNLVSHVARLRYNKIPYGIGLSLIIFVIIFGYNISQNTFKNEPNRQKEQARTIASFVLSKTDNKPFNFALLTPGNSDHAYRYYFEVLGNKPISIDISQNDPERKTVTDQLLVVCEDINCKPLNHPLFEIAGFGPASNVGNWDVSVVKVYKLVHTTFY